MYVHDNRQGRQRHRWRPAMTSMLMLALAAFTHAADFDEKLKAPMMKDAGELRSQAQAYSARFAAAREANAWQLFKDPALAREHFDVAWRIKRAVDERRPLPDLADVGIVPGPDGSVKINSKTHPQWLPIEERLAALLPTWDYALHGPELIQRGFREADIATLQGYIASHDVDRAAQKRALPVALSFNKVVAKYDRLKRPVDYGLAMSFFYQQAQARFDATREWASGLLDALDAQRGRVLVEYISEFETTTLWTPSDPAEAVTEMLTMMRRPDFQQRATAEAQGARP